MRNTIVMSILGSLALCLLVAGCGGGSDSGEAQEIDKTAFVKKAETICEEVSGKLAAEVNAIVSRESAKPGYDPVRDQTKIRTVFVKDAFIAGLNAELEKIRALGLPEEGKQEVQAFVRAMQKVVKTAEANPEAFATAQGPYEEVELAARRFALTGCPITPVGPN